MTLQLSELSIGWFIADLHHYTEIKYLHSLWATCSKLHIFTAVDLLLSPGIAQKT